MCFAILHCVSKDFVVKVKRSEVVGHVESGEKESNRWKTLKIEYAWWAHRAVAGEECDSTDHTGSCKP